MTREKTAFELDHERDMQNPEYRVAYAAARAQIDAIDSLVRSIDAAREEQGISKAELARRMGVQPEAVRRLLSSNTPNPTAKTVIGAATALGYRLRLERAPAA